MSLISELKPEDKLKGYYLCKYKQILKNKNGKDYCTVKLQDKTGIIDGKIWSIHCGIGAFASDDIVLVEGEVVLYQENLQLNITKLDKAQPGSYDLTNFIPQTLKSIAELEKELFEFIDAVLDPFIKKLLESIFYDQETYDLFLAGAAAKSVHHAYLGGLLEHTVSTTKIGIHLTTLYQKVNKDFVIAGCLLHDIGKITELAPFPKNDYTDEGQLIGHITMGALRVAEVANTIPDFPKETKLILQHILLAHHGEYEYGSPKRPKCIEAMIVHLADLADSKLKMFEEMLQDAPSDETYVGYNKILTRNIRQITHAQS